MDFGSKFVYAQESRLRRSDDVDEEDNEEEVIEEEELGEALEQVVEKGKASSAPGGGVFRRMFGRLVDRNGSEQQQEQQQQGARPQRRTRVADTNVISLALGTLGSEAALATGDPVQCEGCRSFLSHISRRAADMWICEFCGHTNSVHVADEEVPEDSTVDYIVEPAPERTGMKDANDGDGSVVFCIDVSGSMCVTTEVPGTFKVPGAGEEELRRRGLAREFGDGGSQFFGNVSRNVTYVSRLQACQLAIETQLDQLSENEPHKTVGIVTFNNEVNIFGDGSGETKVLAGSRLNDIDHCHQSGAATKLSMPVSEARGKLMMHLHSLEERGATALGPAVVAAIGMASNKPGSQVIVTTDGLANVGIGNLESGAQGEFYEKLADLADECGVRVSVISIKGSDCRMEEIGALADRTSGRVDIVDPLHLRDQFAGALSEKVVATDVTVKLQLHKNLFFTEKDAETKQILHRRVGTASVNSDFTFAFSVDPAATMEKIPFQAQISFTAKDGTKRVRVITQERTITRDRNEAENNMDIAVTGLHGLHLQAQLAQEGDYEGCRMKTISHHRMMRRALQSPAVSNRNAYGNVMARQTAVDEEIRGLHANELKSTDGCLESAPKEYKKMARKQRRGDSASNVIYQTKGLSKSGLM